MRNDISSPFLRYMNGLLRDDFSTDNGIILSTAKRWVLMVDPQDIANRWIKTTEKSKSLTVLKQSDKDFLRTLENCIQFGSPVLLENVGDYLDPALEPLLQKQTFQQGGSVCIKLGESTIEYSKVKIINRVAALFATANFIIFPLQDFRMYITTRLRNPHFPPETTAKIAMVNFSITTAGLVDQLLGIIVARERPELEEERSQVTIQLNENKKSLEEIEDRIKNVLYSSKGNILEDENAIKNLSSSKVMANEIVEKQQISETTERRLNDSRAEYLGLTNYAVTLFFAGSALSSINPMYQYRQEKCQEQLGGHFTKFLRSLSQSVLVHQPLLRLAGHCGQVGRAGGEARECQDTFLAREKNKSNFIREYAQRNLILEPVHQHYNWPLRRGQDRVLLPPRLQPQQGQEAHHGL